MKWLQSVGVVSAFFSLLNANTVLVLTDGKHDKSDYTKLDSYLGETFGKARFVDAKKAPKLFVDSQSAYSHLMILDTNPPCTKTL